MTKLYVHFSKQLSCFADLVYQFGVVLDGLGFFYDLAAGAFGGELFFGEGI